MIKHADKQRYLRLLSYVKPHWKTAVLALCATLIYGLTEPLVPLVMQPLLDGGFAERDLNTVYAMVAVLVVGFIVRGLANFTSTYATTTVAQNIVYQLRVEMFAHLVRLPLRYFDQHSHGSLLSRFSYDVVQLMAASTDALIILVRESVTVVALLLALLYLDWKMTLMVMSIAPILAFIIITLSKRLRNLAKTLQEDMSDMNHVVDEVITGREIVRLYNGQHYENNRFYQQAQAIKTHAIASTKLSALISPILEIIIVCALSAVIVFAAQIANSAPNAMTPGKFVAYLTTMALLFPTIKRLGKINEPIQRGLAAAQSIFDFLDQPAEVDTPLTDKNIRAGDIRLEKVDFCYQDKKILDQFSLHIQAGETVALVGESGSGKSTIAALIAGFYQPDAGEIYIDNHPINTLSLAQRREAIALVTQNTILFSGSIASNIAYAQNKYDDLRLKQAAQSAHASEFIEALSNQYHHDIGQKGSRLSGGQKQRIAIARALYKDAPILILDEATSALDNRSEANVQSAIDTLGQDKTTIIIAHRLSTIKNADRIVVLEHGKIVEMGKHDELLKQGGFYAKLLSHFSP